MLKYGYSLEITLLSSFIVFPIDKSNSSVLALIH